MADIDQQDSAVLMAEGRPERRRGRRRDVVILVVGVAYAVVAVAGLTGHHTWDVDGRWVMAAVLVGLGGIGLTAALPGRGGASPSAR